MRFRMNCIDLIAHLQYFRPAVVRVVVVIVVIVVPQPLCVLEDEGELGQEVVLGHEAVGDLVVDLQDWETLLVRHQDLRKKSPLKTNSISKTSQLQKN